MQFSHEKKKSNSYSRIFVGFKMGKQNDECRISFSENHLHNRSKTFKTKNQIELKTIED